MKRVALISLCVFLTACSGSAVDVGKTAGGCTGLSFEQWDAIPNGMSAGGINGVMVEAKIQMPTELRAPFFGVGSTKLTTRAPSVIGITQDGKSAYVMVNSPAVLSWNGKKLKCKAA